MRQYSDQRAVADAPDLQRGSRDTGPGQLVPKSPDYAAGAYGAMTVNKRIFFIQALPAIAATMLGSWG